MITLLILLALVAVILVVIYLKSKPEPLIPELGDENNGIKAVTVNITMAELRTMSDKDKLKSYVVRYLLDHPIPTEHRIDQGLILKYVAEATRLLQPSYSLQFDDPLVCWFNPATFYREVIAEIERLEAHSYRKAHPM